MKPFHLSLALLATALIATTMPLSASDHCHRHGYSSHRYHGNPSVYRHYAGPRYGLYPSVYGGGYYRGYAPYPGGGYYRAAYSPYVSSEVYYRTSYPTTRVSSNTEAAVQLQLARQGYYHGQVDGKIGTKSRQAIRSWQRDQGLAVNGRIDYRLLASLGLR